MAISHEIKSQLAKLLATEDLIVEHKKVETASFNVHTRLLTLPMWEKASGVVYDMLVGHEVGHALYTPDEDWIKEYNISPQFVNIVEDVRIEKLIKRRYAGITKTFFSAYKELAEEDFFCIENEDLSKMNLADRVNLYFKIGNYVSIPFHNEKEEEIVRMISDCETFSDVLIASEILYKYCKEEKMQEKEQKQNSANTSGSGESQTSQSENQNTGDEESEEQGEQVPTDSSAGVDPGDTGESAEESDEPEAKTVSSLEESIKDLIDQSSRETSYYEIPKINIDKIIISNKEVHEKCDEAWAECNDESFHDADSQFNEFKRSSQKEVNYLVKEFECRKSADAYSRSSVNRTGVLDTSKLHTYRFNEDLFKKVTVTPDGKNHGLVFILDWSGSMADVLLDTVKQMFNLVWFCKKVNIPFDVYSFTNEYPNMVYRDGVPVSEERPDVFCIGDWFSLMNILTSKTSSKELESQMKNIFRIAYSFRSYFGTPCPAGWGLSGTPLNESLVCLHEILPKFKKEYKLEKVQCIVLTDGEGAPLKVHKEVKRPWEDEVRICQLWPNQESYLRDRKTGNTYKLSSTYDHYSNFTSIILNNLRDRFVDVNFIGIRVLSRDVSSFIRMYDPYKFEDHMKNWKKERTLSFTDVGYHKYFGMSSNSLSNSSDFNVDHGANKVKIKSAFMKSLRSKKMNKKILGEFVELIA